MHFALCTIDALKIMGSMNRICLYCESKLHAESDGGYFEVVTRRIILSAYHIRSLYHSFMISRCSPYTGDWTGRNSFVFSEPLTVTEAMLSRFPDDLVLEMIQ